MLEKTLKDCRLKGNILIFLFIYLLGCTRSWLWHAGSHSLTRDWTQALPLGVKTLSHWVTREVPAMPGKNTGVGCHFLLQCMKVKSESEVTQSCPTPSDPMDCSPPGSSVHGIFQARVLEWGAIAFSDLGPYLDPNNPL